MRIEDHPFSTELGERFICACLNNLLGKWKSLLLVENTRINCFAQYEFIFSYNSMFNIIHFRRPPWSPTLAMLQLGIGCIAALWWWVGSSSFCKFASTLRPHYIHTPSFTFRDTSHNIQLLFLCQKENLLSKLLDFTFFT